MKYCLTLAFHGANYCGWQRQVNAVSIQQVLEETLQRILQNPELVVSGCSRTDSGVHAVEMTTAFHTVETIDTDQLQSLLKKQLPHDLRVLRIEPAAPDFNAHETCGRAYVYAVNLGFHNIFLPELVWNWPEEIRKDEVRGAVGCFAGTHDFRRFTGKNLEGYDTVRTIFRAELYEFGPLWCFYFSGTGFLHKMVRRMVGGLHSVAVGDLQPEDLANMLEHPAGEYMEAIAPPDGLYLKKAFYSPEEWKQDVLRYPPFIELY